MKKQKQKVKRFIGYQNDLKTSKVSLVILLIATIILSYLIVSGSKWYNYTKTEQTIKTESVLRKIKGVITAYNVGLESQNDNDPCISAYNIDVCQLVEQGVNVIANNCLEKETEIEIEGLGRFVVLDKMNSRYGCEHFDIAMTQDQVVEAIQFGRQNRNIIIK